MIDRRKFYQWFNYLAGVWFIIMEISLSGKFNYVYLLSIGFYFNICFYILLLTFRRIIYLFLLGAYTLLKTFKVDANIVKFSFFIMLLNDK